MVFGKARLRATCALVLLAGSSVSLAQHGEFPSDPPGSAQGDVAEWQAKTQSLQTWLRRNPSRRLGDHGEVLPLDGHQNNFISQRIDEARALVHDYTSGDNTVEHPVEIYLTTLTSLEAEVRGRATVTSDAIRFGALLARQLTPVYETDLYESLGRERIEYWRYLERIVTFIEHVHEAVDVQFYQAADPSQFNQPCPNGCGNHARCGITCSSRSAERLGRTRLRYADALVDFALQFVNHNGQSECEMSTLGVYAIVPLLIYEQTSLEILIQYYESPLASEIQRDLGPRLFYVQQQSTVYLQRYMGSYPNESETVLTAEPIEYRGEGLAEADQIFSEVGAHLSRHLHAWGCRTPDNCRGNCTGSCGATVAANPFRIDTTCGNQNCHRHQRYYRPPSRQRVQDTRGSSYCASHCHNTPVVRDTCRNSDYCSNSHSSCASHDTCQSSYCQSSSHCHNAVHSIPTDNCRSVDNCRTTHDDCRRDTCTSTHCRNSSHCRSSR